MLTIWFIGMYVIFILQQIAIFYLVSRVGKKMIEVLESQDKEIRNKDKVIIELLKRIAILEREVEKYEGF